jgi:hypothetical protein
MPLALQGRTRFHLGIPASVVRAYAKPDMVSVKSMASAQHTYGRRTTTGEAHHVRSVDAPQASRTASRHSRLIGGIGDIGAVPRLSTRHSRHDLPRSPRPPSREAISTSSGTTGTRLGPEISCKTYRTPALLANAEAPVSLNRHNNYGPERGGVANRFNLEKAHKRIEGNHRSRTHNCQLA